MRSCTIITTELNELMSDIHNRLPMILHSEAEKVWLDPEVQDAGLVSTLLCPYRADRMLAYPVSTLVDPPRNDGPECILPVG